MLIFSNSELISLSLVAGSKSFKLKYIVVSSAYIINFNLSVTCIKSFVNMLKSNRPNIDPCETPVVTSTNLELQLLYTTYCFLSNK